ncbi:DNA/RNA helicase domain-containing protein [Eubacterium ramulus]|uniref:DNA/RNA helicase domain-containing protein n=1 Tax=Eubacterium ramulus TaxID=39490 RepID=UPI003522E601
MKSISIYALTRKQNIEHLQKLEQQLSGREHMLKMKEWELESMRALVEQLELHVPDVSALRLFYSFQIPRLGKEFDLLQIKENQIINIELKSGAVSEEAIQKQLIQNRYYLSALGKPIQSYTYISSQNRLMRLTNHDHVIEASWNQLCAALQKEGKDYSGDIENLFRAEWYLFSPLTEPNRFLNKEYFLTAQQRDIKRQILKKIREEQTGYFSFSGLPGTGKTLLLYDIAMKLSNRQQVCIIHCGEAGKKWEILHKRLQRIDFLSDNQLETQFSLEDYHAILVDEAHLLSVEKLNVLLDMSENRPIIFSSDSEEMISPKEMDQSTMKRMEELPDLQTFRLTNRIRTNAELSSFIQNMMHLPVRKNQNGYPHVSVVYANDAKEADTLVQDYVRQGYQYFQQMEGAELGVTAVRDTEKMVVMLDERYYYDEDQYLRSRNPMQNGQSEVRRLFHLLNQAKENLAFVVKENETLYGILLDMK